jgi:sulfide:quinone oxidoreductase
VTASNSNTRHFEFVIIGGGTAGITVASRILNETGDSSLAIIEPSDTHFYQPLWTLVGAGVVDKEETARPMSSVIPDKATWIKDHASELLPRENAIRTRGGQQIAYDYLVVAPGIQMNWDHIPGLQESIGKNGVCSNFAYQYADKTWEFLKNFKEGNAIFTFPATETKCGGAPQKIMWLAEHYLQQHRLRDKANVIFVTPKPGIFGVPHYAEALRKLAKERNIITRFRNNLVEIRSDAKTAVFENLDTGEREALPYEMLHVTPPQSAPDFIRQSPLADEEGWLDVDPYTLQHKKFSNVFGLGDASNLPTAKTGAAIRKQAPVLVTNLLSLRENLPFTEQYNGYTSCPLITGYGRLILAEFDYESQPQETFPFDQRKERYSMYLLKRYVLPLLYWHGMLKGRA